MAIVQATRGGLQVVGERYERQEIFLSGLIMAGEIFRGVMDLVLPDWEDDTPSDGASGRVLLGTVAGDIHDLGKNMAALTFRAFGFAVEDLGVNVPPEDFVEAARRFKPDIIGMSGLLTLAFDSMQETVRLLSEPRRRARDAAHRHRRVHHRRARGRPGSGPTIGPTTRWRASASASAFSKSRR